MQKPSNLLLLVDVPKEAAAKIQHLANSLGVEVAFIAVADALPTVSIPFVKPEVQSPAPIVRLPDSSEFRLLEPDYDCEKHEITFKSNGGGGVEYMAPGVTGWTKSEGPHKVDSAVAKDSKELTLYARLNGKQATPYVFGFKAYCNGKTGQ